MCAYTYSQVRRHIVDYLSHCILAKNAEFLNTIPRKFRAQAAHSSVRYLCIDLC